MIDSEQPPECDGCGRRDGWYKTDGGLVKCDYCEYRSRNVTRRRAEEVVGL